MNQTWLVTAFFFALFLLILYGAFLILSPFLAAITWAVILAILVYPFYAWLLRRVDELGYDGWVGCEYRPRAGTSEGLSWLRRQGFP